MKKKKYKVKINGEIKSTINVTGYFEVYADSEEEVNQIKNNIEMGDNAMFLEDNEVFEKLNENVEYKYADILVIDD